MSRNDAGLRTTVGPARGAGRPTAAGRFRFVLAAALRIANYACMLLIVCAFALPFAWMISTSLKTLPETMIFPPEWIPDHPVWSNYTVAWNSGPFPKYLLNSFFVSAGILALQMLTIIPAAYAFARFRFPGRGLLFGLVMATLMIPPQLIFLPVYLMLSDWKLLNTHLALILPFASSAFGIFLLRQSFLQTAGELIEAARLDHAPEWKIMLRIMAPLARPVLATFALFSFISHWNDYFWPLVMTTNESVRTLPLGIAKIRETEGTATWNVLMAANVMLAVPVLIAFFAAQRHIIRAFVHGGIK
jgi:sn-glycerol 3-phosphate transport system permease protein